MIGKLMMGTVAHGDPKGQKPMDISRENPELMMVEREDGEFWVGHWLEGFGFINVYFPKESTRPCTADEKKAYLAGEFSAPWGTFRLKEDDFA